MIEILFHQGSNGGRAEESQPKDKLSWIKGLLSILQILR